MVFSAVSGGSSHQVAQLNQVVSETASQLATQAPTVVQTQGTAPVSKDVNKGVAEYVNSYFSDIPIMQHVAWCESRDRQYATDGQVFRGEVNNQDVGVMQINEHYHLDTASGANYNLYSVEGNTAYARKLYEKFGTTPWNSSKPCWGKYVGDDSSSAGAIAQANVN